MTPTQRGIALMILTSLVFATQDSISRYLADSYNVVLTVMLRYWFLAVFVLALAARQPGGIAATARTDQLALQIFRGVLLAAQICVAVLSFTLIGLVDTVIVFACYPLLVAALSGPVLGEYVGWRRWLAILAGFVGVAVIVQPGLGAVSVKALLPLLLALMFAIYGLMTRYAARKDNALTSFFWTGIAGAAAVSVAAPFVLEPMTRGDSIWMAILCVTGALGHYMLIRAYELAEASDLQPFAYFHMPFAAALGMVIFGETLSMNVVIGGLIILGAGLFTMLRARQLAGR